jgi:hypothetical protein
MDDDTKALLHMVIAVLDKHADNQELILQNQTAMLGLLQGHQADNIKTGDALNTLVKDLRVARGRVDEARQRAQAVREQARQHLERT